MEPGGIRKNLVFLIHFIAYYYLIIVCLMKKKIFNGNGAPGK